MPNLNFHIEQLLPEDWRQYISPAEGKRGYKFRSREEARDIVCGHEGKHGSIHDFIDTDITPDNSGISFLRLSNSEEPLISITPDIDTTLGIYNDIAVTNRFLRADTDRYRDAHGKEGKIGVMYTHERTSIELIEETLRKIGLILSDPSYLFSVCQCRTVQKAISERFRKLGVYEVAVGSRCHEESAKHHHHNKKGHSMPIMQLLYSPTRIIELDLTYPKPNGTGYPIGQSLWVVQPKG